MKKILFCLTMTFVSMTGMAQVNKSDMDLSVKPGNDFWQYAVGGWLKN